MYEALYYGILILNTQDMSEKGHIVYASNKKTGQEKEKKMLKAMNSQKEVSTKLTKGLLDLIILQFVSTQPMHGYQIITKIRKNFGVYFGPSTVYPLLNTLEKKGFLKSEWNMNSERPRKIYSLTSNGQNMLNFTEESLNLICRKISAQTSPEITMESSTQSAVAVIAKKGISAQTNHLTLQVH
jgi:PadR family transcriptional regulator PadR